LNPTRHDDLVWMRRALAEAERGRGLVEPNPLVGAVVVKDGRALGIGFHGRFGGPHAEIEALAKAGDSARGATLYVTLEPCSHFGKTPPCVDAVIASGITRVVAAMSDPFPKVAGGGLARLREAGVTTEVGLDEKLARRLNAPYLKRLATGLPHVLAKWAMTLDGKIATASGQSAWISSLRSRGLVHETRGRMDAIAVGIGTVLADDPQLTARPPGPRVAARVVLDSAARLPKDSRLARSAREVPVWLAVTRRAPADRLQLLESVGVEIVSFPQDGPVPIIPLLQELSRRNVTNLLVEGGGRILGAFLNAGQIDAVDVFIAPQVEGGTHAYSPVLGVGVSLMSEAPRLEQHSIQLVDGDVRIEGTFARPWLIADLA
jgi:diaminohydroxyphosphoribosylaminopyrimidine deaminase/5-amino-6-(5-phosphoribosylamino)uracil reductase